ncbi:MAG: ABC transporter ATP-binding protein [Fusobacteriaceae bacterium]
MKIKNLSKAYGELKIFENLNIEFSKNKISVILGNSGCGKSTLLNLISDNTLKYTGTIENNEKFISYIFQEDLLIPWKTVYENVEYVLNLKDEIKKNNIINNNLTLVDLYEYKNFYPHELSGGMKKRVGIARAFSFPSTLLLLDEPFASLDINITKTILKDFIKLQNKNPKTVILVTHNIDIASILADEIFILTDKPTTLKISFKRISYSSNQNYKNDILKHLNF